MEQFTPGQTVYLDNGQVAEYISICPAGGHVVCPIFTRYYSDIGDIEEPGNPKIVDNVYSSPAIEKLSDLVKSLEKKRNELYSELTAIRGEIYQKNIESENLSIAIDKYPDIKTAVDFLEGRITHLVQLNHYSGLQIRSLKDSLEDVEDGYYEGLRLISLYGTDRYKKPMWKLNRYRDGSGHWMIVYPFSSEQEAKEFSQKVLNDNIQCFLQKQEVDPDIKINISNSIRNNPWLNVPIEWTYRQVSIDLKSKLEKIKKQKEALEKEEAEAFQLQCSLEKLTTQNPNPPKTQIQ